MPFTVEQYIQCWSEAAAAILSQVGGIGYRSEVSSGAAPENAAEISVRFALKEPLAGEHAFSVSRADALCLAQILLGEMPDSKIAFGTEHADAVAELFRQIAGDAAVRVKNAVGSDVVIEFVALEAPQWQPASSACLKLKGGANEVTVVLNISAELQSAISGVSGSDATSTETAPAASAEVSVPRQPADPDRNLDLLMDVPLQVKLRFGQRQMPLREVLDLSDGAVVELDREIDEPAELLLGDKIIARGEVVIVDGNYGLRILEVASPQQRMASTRS